jgi:hypothetical protein
MGGLLGPIDVGVVGGEIEELLDAVSGREEDLKIGTPVIIDWLEVENETVPFEDDRARLLVELSWVITLVIWTTTSVTCITLLEVPTRLLIVSTELMAVEVGLSVVPVVLVISSATLLRLEVVLDVMGVMVDAPMTIHILEFTSNALEVAYVLFAIRTPGPPDVVDKLVALATVGKGKVCTLPPGVCTTTPLVPKLNTSWLDRVTSGPPSTIICVPTDTKFPPGSTVSAAPFTVPMMDPVTAGPATGRVYAEAPPPSLCTTSPSAFKVATTFVPGKVTGEPPTVSVWEWITTVDAPAAAETTSPAIVAIGTRAGTFTGVFWTGVGATCPGSTTEFACCVTATLAVAINIPEAPTDTTAGFSKPSVSVICDSTLAVDPFGRTMFGESGWAMIVLEPIIVRILIDDGWWGTTGVGGKDVVGGGESWSSVGSCDTLAIGGGSEFWFLVGTWDVVSFGGGGGFWFSAGGCDTLNVGGGGGLATGERELLVVADVGVAIGGGIVGAAAAGSVDDVGTGGGAEGRRPPVIGGTAPADEAQRLDSLEVWLWN